MSSTPNVPQLSTTFISECEAASACIIETGTVARANNRECTAAGAHVRNPRDERLDLQPSLRPSRAPQRRWPSPPHLRPRRRSRRRVQNPVCSCLVWATSPCLSRLLCVRTHRSFPLSFAFLSAGCVSPCVSLACVSDQVCSL